MKKLVFIAVIVLAAAAAAWYFLRPGDKARDVVPADAVAVAVFNPLELFKGLGLKVEEVNELDQSLKDLMAAVDMEEPVYAFAMKSGLTGMVLNVSDAGKLQETASSFGYASEQQQGMMWITNSQSIGCLDADKLLLCGPALGSQQDALRSEMLHLMKQSRQDVPLLDKSSLQDGFLRLSASLSSLPKEYVPGDVKVSDAFLNASLSIGNQNIALSASVVDEEGKPLGSLLAGEELLRPIEGLLPTVLPDNPFAWLCLNIKGEQLLRILRSSPKVGAALMMLNVAFFDADLMLKAIDGDVVVMMPEADLARKEVVVTARVSNTDFLKGAEEWDTTSMQNGMSLRKRGEADDYVFTYQGEKLCFGVRGDFLYLASSERMADRVLLESEQGILQPMVAGKYLCGSVDLGQLVKNYALAAIMLGAAPQLYEAVDAVDKLHLTADRPQSIHLDLTTKKPIKEIVAKLKNK